MSNLRYVQFRYYRQAQDINLEHASEKITKALYKRCKVAAKEFLITAAGIIPVWSGMALASFIPLARELHVALHVVPVATQKGKGGSRVPYNRVSQGISAAQGVSGFKNHIIVLANQKVQFTFRSNVPHLAVNDVENVNITRGMHLINPGPWLSMQSAGEAFKNAIRVYGRSELYLVSVEEMLATKNEIRKSHGLPPTEKW